MLFDDIRMDQLHTEVSQVTELGEKTGRYFMWMKFKFLNSSVMSEKGAVGGGLSDADDIPLADEDGEEVKVDSLAEPQSKE